MKSVLFLSLLFLFNFFTGYSQTKYEIKYSYGAPHMNQDHERTFFIDGDKAQYNHHQRYEELETPQGWNVKVFQNFYTIFTEGNQVTFIRELENGTILHSTYEQEKLAWELSNETKEILGYTCQKAVLRNKYVKPHMADPQSGDVIAWFTTDISSPAGIESLDGLPGLILRVDYSITNAFRILATSINSFDGSLDLPEKGIEVSSEVVWNPNVLNRKERRSYKKMYEEKLEDK
ncbi:MAG: GLPGLI family protein [Cyclobacteriaceae bacterium]|nr:GLPGLI family protein [Cyclobacteriaceae bacterium]